MMEVGTGDLRWILSGALTVRVRIGAVILKIVDENVGVCHRSYHTTAATDNNPNAKYTEISHIYGRTL